jgi:hypothetical protein
MSLTALRTVGVDNEAYLIRTAFWFRAILCSHWVDANSAENRFNERAQQWESVFSQ